MRASAGHYFLDTHGRIRVTAYMRKTAREKRPGFLTIDVEDFYHIIGVRGTPPVEAWDRLPSRVEIGLERYFELLAAKEVKATMFFLGYIARRHPGLVRRAIELEHEVASHGMYHREVSKIDSDEFYRDARESRLLLEDISGVKVRGMRSPGFSIGGATPWFFDRLLEAGYEYDSSALPIRWDRRSISGGSLAPGYVVCSGGRIFEFPITVARLLGLRVSMFGGGYLRFFPQWLISVMARKVLHEYPLTIYIHPREIDPGHPRIEMNAYRKFKSYINLASVPAKLEMLMGSTRFLRMGDYYDASK